jgi:hypothetical protein
LTDRLGQINHESTVDESFNDLPIVSMSFWMNDLPIVSIFFFPRGYRAEGILVGRPGSWWQLSGTCGLGESLHGLSRGSRAMAAMGMVKDSRVSGWSCEWENHRNWMGCHGGSEVFSTTRIKKAVHIDAHHQCSVADS